jgi:hypothetical protein|tara:strand:+ start:494 stop:658 length:165 start_codon:yes stop_codon:yes gene_type:complete
MNLHPRTFLGPLFDVQRDSSYKGISIPYLISFLNYFLAIVNKNIINMGGGCYGK